MEQEPVIFRATIVDPKFEDPPFVPPPIPPPPPSPEMICEECCMPEPEPEIPKPQIKSGCCLPEPEHAFERQSELADALPTIFMGIGVAYAIGILTGFVIFSSPSMALEL